MRLSLPKAAHAGVGECSVTGNPDGAGAGQISGVLPYVTKV
jgi:hypothetical protein